MKYSSAVAFRAALENRLKVARRGGAATLSRDRKRVAFDRCLARMVAVAPGVWSLKGGFALDLRIADRDRFTKDIDVVWHPADDVLDVLITAASHDAGDFFNFEIERDTTPADLLGGSQRFRVRASLAGRLFETFVVDVGVLEQDELSQEILLTPNLLQFAGIAPVRVPAVSLAEQIAEKLHAYTRTYEGGRASTRVKDLVDLVLIASASEVEAAEVKRAIDVVFGRRATHPVPSRLPEPPADWMVPYRRLASPLGVTDDLNRGLLVAAALLDPILQGRQRRARWSPEAVAWVESS